MKITKCDYCGQEITMKTDICPACGEKMGIKTRGIGGLTRRIIFFLMAVYVIYSAVRFFLEN